MFKILKKQVLNSIVTRMIVSAPLVASKAMPGQFVILRVRENGERIPLTIADFDRREGTITLIYQVIGKSTMLLDELSENDFILNLVGPLGKPSECDATYRKVAIVAGGVGCAIAYPQAKAFHENGVAVDIIAGFRNKDIVILEDEMRRVSDSLMITTDDGSNGKQGFVTDVLVERLGEYDLVVAVGPLPMMKAVSDLTRGKVKTIVSMNPIMIDGTGMCGGCRLTVNGKNKFACIDGPDFDGHEVDFLETMRRLKTYKSQEDRSRSGHLCHLKGDCYNV